MSSRAGRCFSSGLCIYCTCRPGIFAADTAGIRIAKSHPGPVGGDNLTYSTITTCSAPLSLSRRVTDGGSVTTRFFSPSGGFHPCWVSSQILQMDNSNNTVRLRKRVRVSGCCFCFLANITINQDTRSPFQLLLLFGIWLAKNRG